MTGINFIKPERLSLLKHSTLTEKWVQDRIAEDPSILGLGPLVLKDKERFQPHAGRLDLLLQDPDTGRRYEVEVQLGKTNESHIIRTIEYWDIERRRYPQYEHCAVLVAEEITSRFLNVISMFNGNIPLIAIQMTARKWGDQLSLDFTTVLDVLPLGLVDEDEVVTETTDRASWEQQTSKATLGIADDLLKIIHTFAPGYELKYNKYYIGLAKDGQADNFAAFLPKKNYLFVVPRLPQSEDTRKQLEQDGLDLTGYDKSWERYRIRVAEADVQKQRDSLTRLLKMACRGDDGEVPPSAE